MNIAAVNNATTALTNIAAVAQTVEGMAAQAPAGVTGAQKVQAALSIAAALDPAATSGIVATEGLFSALVAVWNMFGAFAHKPTAS